MLQVVFQSDASHIDFDASLWKSTETSLLESFSIAEVLDICYGFVAMTPVPKTSKIFSTFSERLAEKKAYDKHDTSSTATWDDVGGYEDVKMVRISSIFSFL